MPQPGEDVLGFILWNNQNTGQLILQGYGGGVETGFPNNPYVPDTDYYVEVAVDGRFAVVTVRTQSFTGPVHSAVSSDEVGLIPPGLDQVGIKNPGSAGQLELDFAA
jgi:hypothetical protein